MGVIFGRLSSWPEILTLALKTINVPSYTLSTETVRALDQIICTRRQIFFEPFRSNRFKIGMNATENKLYHISKLVILEKIDLNYVHFKKKMKVQFLKFGKT